MNNSNNDSEQEYSTLRKLPLIPSSIEKKRYSSPPYYGYDKPYKKYGSKDNRNVRSMNETVEVLADQVIEQVSVSVNKKKTIQLDLLKRCMSNVPLEYLWV